MSTQAIPLGLDDFVLGGLPSDIDVEITQIAYRGFDYNGTQKEVLAVRTMLQGLDEHAKRNNDPPIENYFSCGPELEESGIVISDDGYSAKPGPNKGALTQSCNFYVFLSSLVALGMPKDFLHSGSIKPLIGLKFHLVRQAAPKGRETLEGSSKKKEKGYKDEVVIANRIIAAPWLKGGKPVVAAQKTEAAAGGQTNGAAAATAEAVTPAAEAPGQELTRKTIKAILDENKGTIESLDALRVQTFRKLQSEKAEIRNAAARDAGSADWLAANGFAVMDADDKGNRAVIG